MVKPFDSLQTTAKLVPGSGSFGVWFISGNIVVITSRILAFAVSICSIVNIGMFRHKHDAKHGGYILYTAHAMSLTRWTADTPRKTAEAPRKSAEAPRKTAEAPRKTAEAPRKTADPAQLWD